MPSLISSIGSKNPRYKIALCANIVVEYPQVYSAVTNALDPEGTDFSNGGCWWDGMDLATKGPRQLHYKWGYKFTDPSHDIYSLGDTPLKLKYKKRANNTVYSYYYTLESTAAYGGTVFWKYTPEYLAGGNTQCH